jgi:hypothetical protein
MRAPSSAQMILALLLAIQAGCSRAPTATSQPGAVATPLATAAPATGTPAPAASRTPMLAPSATRTPVATPAPLSEGSTPVLQSLRMSDETTGWALAAGTLLRTSDGGRRWQDVTPAGARGCLLAWDTQDGERAWLAATSAGLAATVAVYRTADGGRSWQGMTSLATLQGEARGMSLSAYDSLHAWLLVQGSSSPARALYATADGGASWTAVARGDSSASASSLPDGGAIRFTSPTVGWLTSGGLSAPLARLNVTRDGGRTWQAVELESAKAGALSFDLPSFAADGQHEGVLFALDPAEAALLFFVTSDGGRTWQCDWAYRSAGAVCSALGGQGWAWVALHPVPGATPPPGGMLFHLDVSRIMQTQEETPTLATFLQPGDALQQLAFVPSGAGWAILRRADGRTNLLATPDGGRSWELVDARIGEPLAVVSTPVEGWIGVVTGAQGAGETGDTFLRADGQEYGIDGSATGLTARLQQARAQKETIQVWGRLLSAVGDASDRRIVVERMAAGPFERQQLNAGEVVGRPGVFFLQVSTGEVEAWALPGEENARYSASPDNRWVIAYTPSATYAADRRSGAAYRWDGSSTRLLAAQGDFLVLLENGQVRIAEPGHPELVALPIRPADANSPTVVISADGGTAAILNGRTLYRVQLASATCAPMAEVADLTGSMVTSAGLGTTRRGDAIVVTSYLSPGVSTDHQPAQRIQRYSWQGERLGEVTVPRASLCLVSPDGRWVAWEERLSEMTQAVVVADAATLAPRFRVLSATLCYWGYGFADWLADSSGLIVRTNEGYRILSADGKLGDVLTQDGKPLSPNYELLPAPDRGDLMAVYRKAVVDLAGRTLAAANLGSGTWNQPADLYPWGYNSNEMRFALPHLGHGGKCGEDEYLLAARVEPVPFAPLALAVGLSAADCANLRAEPGRNAPIIACLPGGTRLSPAPLPEQPGATGSEPYYLTPDIAWADSSRWLRLRTEDGREGWVDAAAAQITWAE